jgi:LmbE family N-acetylglucosaminyl deacetylase
MAARKMLLCLAHPDDESFGMGGTIAKYASAGAEITLVCATKGEAGTVDDDFLEGYESIADLREKELSCAARKLEIKKVIYLDYRDSGMAGSSDNQHKQAFMQAKESVVAAKLDKIFQDVKPEIVITFDETGGYHHPDHIAIHKATVRAFENNEGKFQPEALYFMARSRKRLRRIVRLMPLLGKNPKKYGRNEDIDLTQLVADGDTVPHVAIEYSEVLAKKEAADRCHASQFDGSGSGTNFITRLIRRVGKNEDTFTRYLPLAADNYRSKDLFEI